MDVLINGEIVLYGTVGARFLPDVEYFNDVDVKTALTKIGKKDVNVRINSGGGIADNGVAIYNLLKEHPGKVKVSIDGVAASAASVIAMAGDTILMRTGALMMVHKAQSFSIGNSDDHQKQIDALKAVDGGMVDIYAQRTGRPRADIEAEMAAETWMNGDQAVSKKYATGVETSPSMRAAAFDYRLYSHAPERMVALAAMLAGEWTPPPAPEPPHTKFWQFIKSHGKAAAALAAAFDAEFKGQPLASNIAFAEIWNAAQR
ncbi:MAG: Clp protease ClpP, partial [Mesorhizobium sp.]